MRFEVSRDINASPASIWPVLTSARLLQNGSFGITRIEGEIAAGAKIRVWSEVNPGRAFPLKVTEFEPERKMVWRSGMPLGLFQGVRTFTLTPSAGATRFHMQEVYSGVLAGLITKSIPDLGPSFEKFASALKSASEGRS